MLSDDQLIAHLAGKLPPEERARVESALANDPESMRCVLDHERLDVALHLLLNPAAGRERVKASVLSGIRTAAHDESAAAVMRRVAEESAKPVPPARPAPQRDPGLLELIESLSGWLRTAQGRVVLATAAVALILGVVWFTRRDSSSGGGNVAGPVAPALRDPAQWPFAATSPWNASIGSAARYETPVANGEPIVFAATMVNSERFHPVIRASASNGLHRLIRSGETNPVATVRAPIDQFPIGADAVNVELISDDNRTLYELKRARREGADIVADFVTVADLTGAGVPPEFRPATHSGLSPFAGSLCDADFRGPIRRALGAVIEAAFVARKPDGTAHTWPAGWSPAGARIADRFATSGNVHLGSLLAIPPEVDIAQLGVGNSGPAYEIARALQDYGLYVKDPVEWDESKPTLLLCGDLTRGPGLPPDFERQLSLVTAHLRVVVNNSASSVGGGGAPRRPVAPPFAKP